ncbi:MAG: endolytic transglycosylase MltG, partial [Rhizomicrobium sp.]
MARVFAILLVMAALIGGGLLWERMEFAAPGPPARNGGRETVVDIAPRQSVWVIANRLQTTGTVRSAALFALGVRLRGEGARLKAGEYAIPSRDSMQSLADLLISGRAIEHKLTAAEGLTSRMIAAIVNADRELAGPAQAPPQEGTLLPETYLFTKGVKRSAMLARMHEAQTRFLSEVWA